MRPILVIIFVLNIFFVYAQDKQDVVSCTQTLTGEVRDKITTDILSEAIVVLSDKNGNVIETQMVKKDGIFSFIVKCETAYGLEGKKTEFTSESKTFTTDDKAGKVLKLLILLDKGNIDFITDAKAKKVTSDTLAKMEDVKSIDLPDPVADVISMPIEKKSALIIEPIYFDYESSWLNQKAKNQLQKVIDLMNENPKIVLECGGHADSKGTDSYNQWMSDRRAKRVVDYLVQGGISSSRVSGKGYGEKKLVNQCTDQVSCTDAQRAVNRRVEFVLKKM
jgi:outer membrane protein OmpA-like peptidoglycan-associated protein